MEVQAEGFGRWRLSGFYGYLGWNRCRESWQLMCSLLDKSTLPWIILGDFNDLLYASEKESRNSQPQWLLNDFRNALQFCGLFDLDYVGTKFTWTNRQKGKITRERLDKAVGSMAWSHMFSQAILYVMEATKSDHSLYFFHCLIL